jgi:hypothetical protein
MKQASRPVREFPTPVSGFPAHSGQQQAGFAPKVMGGFFDPQLTDSLTDIWRQCNRHRNTTENSRS